jgi:hypothetical protein
LPPRGTSLRRGLAHLWNRCCRGPAAVPELTSGESVTVAPARTAGPAWPSTPTSASTASSSKEFGAVTDPGLVDTPAADCDALGLLESDAGALDGDAEAADGTGQRTLPRPAMGNSRSSRPSRTP